MQKNKGAFTLVELIVVITILAILATIWFYSFQWFARDSRNSVRISDLRSIEKVLSLYKTYNDVFPKPTNGTLVTDSWSELWEQWTFGVLTRKIIWSTSNISKIPVDPLTWDEYTYSLLNTKREMQLAAVFEWDLSLNLDMVNETYAAWMYWTTYITWDFNGKIVKTWNCNSMKILAIPSIIKWNTDKTDIIEILNEKKLAYKWGRILPESYGWLATFTEQLPEWNIVNTASIKVFEGTCEELKDETIQQEFIDNLKLAFEGTVVEDQTSIKPIIEDPSLYIAQTLINTNVSEKIKVTVENISSTLNNGLSWQQIDPNCDKSDIVIWNQIWAWCNATIWSGIEFTKTGDDSCFNYEWNNSQECSDMQNLSTAKENAWFTWTNNGDSAVDNIWWKLYSYNNLPIISWWHVPTIEEYEELMRNMWDEDGDGLWWTWHSWKNSSNNIIEALKMPLWGYDYNWNTSDRGNFWPYWTSSLDDEDKIYIYSVVWDEYFNTDSWIPNEISIPVRYIKDWLKCAIQPTYEHATFVDWNPTVAWTAWQDTDSWEACYYGCTDWFSWNDCSTPPPECATQPTYDHATFVAWSPRSDWAVWQDTDSWEACYYSCTDWYSWDDCSTSPSPCVAGLWDWWADTLNVFFDWSWYNWDKDYWCDLNRIYAYNKWLNWNIPVEIWNLLNLTYLDLRVNHLNWNIPVEIWNLINLTNLYLSHNSLDWTIPSEIWNLTNLTHISLNSNSLNWNIPVEIWNLTNLTRISLNSNSLNWNIPVEIWNLTNLTWIDLDLNSLSWNIPSEIWNLTNLTQINLSYNNLDWNIPVEIWNLANLTGINLSSNSLNWNIPVEIWNLTNLTNLYLDHNSLDWNIPSEIWNLANLTQINLCYNDLDWNIPVEIWNLANLTWVDLAWNSLNWNIPSEIWNLTNLTYLYLNNNEFVWDIPVEIWNLTNLRYLNLNNAFALREGGNWAIPTEIWNLTNLNYLNLGLNSLDWNIPIEIWNLINLTHLELSDNYLDWTIPVEIWNLTKLKWLFLNNNSWDFGDLEYDFNSIRTESKTEWNITISTNGSDPISIVID